MARVVYWALFTVILYKFVALHLLVSAVVAYIASILALVPTVYIVDRIGARREAKGAEIEQKESSQTESEKS